jgi:hypothetical protein
MRTSTSAAVAVADAPAVARERNTAPFSSLALNGIGKVRIHRGPHKVVVTLTGDLQDRFETIVKGDRLMVGFRCGIGTLMAIRNVKTCEVDVTMPELDGIEINGAGTIVADAFTGTEVRIVQNGSGVLHGDLSCESLSLTANGAGNIVLRGSAAKLAIATTGNERIDARALVARVGRIRVTGAGRVEAQVEEALEAAVSGAGEILYGGSPRVTQRVTGAGTIRQADG